MGGGGTTGNGRAVSMCTRGQRVVTWAALKIPWMAHGAEVMRRKMAWINSLREPGKSRGLPAPPGHGNYEDTGSSWDGLHDDVPAVRSCHAVAESPPVSLVQLSTVALASQIG